MASEFPGSPQLQKGALVVFESRVPIPTSLVIFQYNPETMNRAFQRVAAPDPKGGTDARHAQAPAETYKIAIELDATDQLEAKDGVAGALGLHPALAQLELLLYPPSSQLILSKALALVGSALVKPLETPVALLVWGAARVVPVVIGSLSVTERAFDPNLNPIHAKVDLGFRALTDKELTEIGGPFAVLSVVLQVAKEAMARLGMVQGAERITGVLPF